MAETIEFDERVNRLVRQQIEGHGGPPYDGSMDDHRLTFLETRLETILPTLATKADVSDAKADIIKWTALVSAAMTAIVISVLAFMLNRAIPLPSSAAPSPIIITVPAAPIVTPQTPQAAPKK